MCHVKGGAKHNESEGVQNGLNLWRGHAGAAKGIGYACAQCLGKEGAAIIVADIDDEGARRAAQQLQDQQIGASAFKCDVGNKAEVRLQHEAAGPRFAC